MKRQRLPCGKWFLDKKRKNNEGVKEKSEVTTRIQTPNVLHGDLAFITLRYLNISY